MSTATQDAPNTSAPAGPATYGLRLCTHPAFSPRIYRLDLMAERQEPAHAVDMHLTRTLQARKRPADNELYDRGCDLVEAAMAIRRRCDDRSAARAVPALLGCMESALHELGCAVSSLDEASNEAPVPPEIAQRLNRGFMSLGLALADAEIASSAARGLAERAAVAATEADAARVDALRSLSPRRHR